jgi:hypothetical protein
MNKLENALACLGLNQSFFDELKSEIETEKLVTENGLLTATKEDVEDELEQLPAEVDSDPVDEEDENQVEMDLISPNMRELYK